MRLFCAVEIPDGIKTRLQELTDRLRPLAKLSWSPTENLHVTTKFIGEWPEARLGEVNRALAEVPRSGPFEISVKGLGFFPNERNPRVFWAGIEAGSELSDLARETDRCLGVLGVPVEARTGPALPPNLSISPPDPAAPGSVVRANFFEQREFHPHLTLARRRNPVPIDQLRRELEKVASTDFGSFVARSFFLYLSKSGRYTKLQEFTLVSQ